MASVSLIQDKLNAYTDGQTLDAQTDWESTTRSGSGVPTSDQHTAHAPDQVIDMSTTGYSDNVFVSDTLDDDDQAVSICFFPDNDEYQESRCSPLLRLQDADPVTINGYAVEVRSVKGSSIDQNFTVFISKVVDGSRTTLASYSNTLADDQRFERLGMVTIVARIVGTTISCELNGRFIGSTTDSTYTTGGYVGFEFDRVDARTQGQPFVQQFSAWTPNEANVVLDAGEIVRSTVELQGTNQTGAAQTRDIVTPTAGNLLLCALGAEDNGNNDSPTFTVSDSASGTWTNEGSVTSTTGTLYVWSKTAAGTETTVTTDPSTESRWNWSVIELDSAWSVDDIAVGSGDQTTATLSSDQKMGLAVVFRGTGNDTTVSDATFDRPLLFQISQIAEPANDGVNRFSVFGKDLGTATTAFTANADASTDVWTAAIALKKAGGPTTVTGTASLTATPSLTATGSVTEAVETGTASLTTGATLSADGTVTAIVTGTATFGPVAGSLSATGTVTEATTTGTATLGPVTGSLDATATVTEAVTTGTASLSTSGTLDADATVAEATTTGTAAFGPVAAALSASGSSVEGVISGTATFGPTVAALVAFGTGAAEVVTGTASLTTSASLTATGTPSEGVTSGTADLTTGASLAATGTPTEGVTSGTADLTTGGSLTVTGSSVEGVTTGTADLTTTATLAAVGAIEGIAAGVAALTSTPALEVTAVVTVYATVTLTTTATLDAVGGAQQEVTTGTASLTAGAALAATGSSVEGVTVGVVTLTSTPELSAVGTATGYGTALLVGTALLTALGTVYDPTGKPVTTGELTTTWADPGRTTVYADPGRTTLWAANDRELTWNR